MTTSPSGATDPAGSDQVIADTAAPRQSAASSLRDAPTPESWRFAEDFCEESEIAATARQTGASFGAAPVLRGTTSTLTLLARTIKARAVVEIGSGAGVSGLAFFAGMEPDGILTSVDIEPEHQHAARQAFESAGIASRRFRLIAGDALSVLPKLSDEAYDMVLIDADKLEYPSYVQQALRLLHHGGLLLVDNTLWHNRTADQNNADDETEAIRATVQAVQQDESLVSTLLPVGDGLLVALRT